MPDPVEVAVIPAAGLGTRFLPISKTIPKEMLPVIDTPVIDLVVAEALAAGIREVVVVSAPGKTALDAYFRPAPDLVRRLEKEGRERELALARRGETLGHVRIVHQKLPRGNGDAILAARDLVGGRPFLVIWGDDLTVAEPVVARQLIETRERLGGGCVLAVTRVSAGEMARFAVVEGEPVDERTWRIRRIVEKPLERTNGGLASVHAYVLEPEILTALERIGPGRGGEIWLTDAIHALKDEIPVYAYEFQGERYDVGDRAGYVRAFVAAALERPDIGPALRPWLAERLGGTLL
jgi:UTP--glucose-1-phosphate uridylyltransferase